MRGLLVVLVLCEVASFVFGALIHSGVRVFGILEGHGTMEAVVQAVIALLMAVTAYAIATRRSWAWRFALGTHGVALAGYLFGLAQGLAANAPSPDLAWYNVMRGLLLVLVTIVLCVPGSRLTLQR